MPNYEFLVTDLRKDPTVQNLQAADTIELLAALVSQQENIIHEYRQRLCDSRK